MLICQTRLTAPDPGRVSQQARQHMDRTIFSHPKSRHRPMPSSTLISFSLSHFLCPSLNSLPPSLSLSLSLLPLPFISVLAHPPSSHFCFITVVPLTVSPLLVCPSFPSYLPNSSSLVPLCPLFQSLVSVSCFPNSF